MLTSPRYQASRDPLAVGKTIAQAIAKYNRPSAGAQAPRSEATHG